MPLPPRAFILATLLTCTAALAEKPQSWTPGELALLPEYCPDSQGFDHTRTGERKSPRAEHWVSLMGEAFWSVHHYCWGLMNFRRAQAAGLNAQQRTYLITSAIQDYHFVVRNATADFPLLPEIFSRIGEAHLLLGQISPASEAFDNARRLKPDYWPPYVAWAEAMAKRGLKEEAKASIETAVDRMPNEPRVIELALKLGVSRTRIATAQAAAASRAALPAEPASAAASAADSGASAP